MVQYDRARVDAWIAKAQELGHQEVASLWFQLAFCHLTFFQDEELGDLLSDLMREWATFSLWEQQHALFEFVPVIRKIASEQADQRHREAREKEPL